MSKRATGSLRGALWLLATLLSGCQAPLNQLHELAKANGRQVHTLPGSPLLMMLTSDLV